MAKKVKKDEQVEVAPAEVKQEVPVTSTAEADVFVRLNKEGSARSPRFQLQENGFYKLVAPLEANEKLVEIHGVKFVEVTLPAETHLL